MHIVLFCATRRGQTVLEHLARLAPPGARITVFSFREEPFEPRFFDALKDTAQRVGASFHEAKHVGADAWASFWEATPVDLMIAAGWRFLIPATVFKRARLGAFVLHDSFLPKYRGFSPTVWAIANGETQTGATLFAMVEGFDLGEIVGQIAVPIGPHDTIAQVMDAVTAQYVALLEKHLPALVAGTPTLLAQDPMRASYVCKRLPEDNEINWRDTTRRIYDLVRATTRPYTGARTTLAGRPLVIWRARPHDDTRHWSGRVPGRVYEVLEGVGSVVFTGDGALLVEEVQEPGAEPVRADAVLNRLSHTLGR